MVTLGLILAGYLWGSLSPTFIFVRLWKGIDLRHYGTGTVGGSNAGEQLGRAWGLALGGLDVVKGFVPAFLLRLLGFDLSTAVLVSLATAIGHNWSLYLGFTGGRGMSITIGVLCALDFRLAVLILFSMVVGRLIRQSAPASLIGLIMLAPAAWLLQDPPEVILAGAGVALIILIKRLEANRLPLPKTAAEKRAVLLRRLWMDRDVPRSQDWEQRKEIRPA